MKEENSVNPADFYLGRITQFFIDNPTHDILEWQVHIDAVPVLISFLLSEKKRVHIELGGVERTGYEYVLMSSSGGKDKL